jgi:hypothetical protein
MTTVDEALARAVEHLRPPPVETLPQWIERVVSLPEGMAQPGPVKLWRPPFSLRYGFRRYTTRWSRLQHASEDGSLGADSGATKA